MLLTRLLFAGAILVILASCAKKPLPLIKGSYQDFQPKYQLKTLEERDDSLLELAQLRAAEEFPGNLKSHLKNPHGDSIEFWVSLLAWTQNFNDRTSPTDLDSVLGLAKSCSVSADPLLRWLQSQFAQKMGSRIQEFDSKWVELAVVKPASVIVPRTEIRVEDSLAVDTVYTVRSCKKHFDSLWIKAFELEQGEAWEQSLVAYDQYLLGLDSNSLNCNIRGFLDQSERRAQAWFRKGFTLSKSGQDSLALAWLADTSNLKKMPLMIQGASRMLRAIRLADKDSGAASQIWKSQFQDHPTNYYGWLARRALKLAGPILDSNALAPIYRCSPPLNGISQALKEMLVFGMSTAARKMIKELSPCTNPQDLLMWSKIASDYGDPALSYQLSRRIVEDEVPRQTLNKIPNVLGQLFYPRPYSDIVRAASLEFGVDSMLVWSIMRQESTFDPQIKSHVGAVGLMQLMPATARFLADSLQISEWQDSLLTNPQYNIRLGTYYLAQLLKQHGDPIYAIAHYNGGPAAARRWQAHARAKGLIPEIAVEEISYRETRDYVKKVSANWWNYDALFRVGP